MKIFCPQSFSGNLHSFLLNKNPGIILIPIFILMHTVCFSQIKIDNYNNVGVGNPTPTVKLDVIGGVKISSLDTDSIPPATNGTTKMVVTDSNGGLSFAAIPQGGGGTVTSIATNNGITGGTITATGTIGLTGQALAFHNLNSNGIVVRNGSDSVVSRSIEPGDGIKISNGNGVNNNPEISSVSSHFGQISLAWDTMTLSSSPLIVDFEDGYTSHMNFSLGYDTLIIAENGIYEISYSGFFNLNSPYLSNVSFSLMIFNGTNEIIHPLGYTLVYGDINHFSNTYPICKSFITPLNSGDKIYIKFERWGGSSTQINLSAFNLNIKRLK